MESHKIHVPNHQPDHIYPLVMTNIAMENPNHKMEVLAGKIIYKWTIYTMAMLKPWLVHHHMAVCQNLVPL